MLSVNRWSAAWVLLLSVTAAQLVACGNPGGEQAAGLVVVATTPDAGDLVSVIAGDRARVTVLTEGPSDPHTVEPRQSMVRVLAKADLLVAIGQGLEKNWLYGLTNRAGNASIKEGGSAYLTLDTAVDLIDESHHAHHGEFDPEAMAVSLHPAGDPHYMLDPLNGVKIASAIRDKLSELDPAGAEVFTANYEVFAKQIETLVNGEDGTSGLAARFAPFRGVKFVGDHDLWTYFAQRFGLEAAGYMEQVPGVPPSVPHMQGLVKTMKTDKVKLILAAPYFDQRHADFLAKNTSAGVVVMAHQVEGVPEAKTYLEACRYNAEMVLKVLTSSE